MRRVALFLLFCLLPTLASTFCASEDSLSSSAQFCYHLYAVPRLSFYDAEDICDAYQGHLVSIHNGFDNSIIVNMIRTFFRANTQYDNTGNTQNKTKKFRRKFLHRHRQRRLDRWSEIHGHLGVVLARWQLPEFHELGQGRAEPEHRPQVRRAVQH